MGTEVLRPQDCLIERIRVPQPVISRRKSYYGYNSNSRNNYAGASRPSRKPVTRPERSDQRKRVAAGPSQPPAEASVSRRHHGHDDSRMARSSGLVMEKVTILRRGESLDSMIKSEALKKEGDDLVVVGTQRLGPDPEMVPKQIRIVDLKPGGFSVVKSDVYAGSAFAAVSPSPSALPLPSFHQKKKQSSAAAAVDDSATRDLRRLLRLE